MSVSLIKSPFGDHINQLSTESIIVDYNTPRCNRAKLDTGTYCNYDCEFCYYRDKLDIKTPFDIIKSRADYLSAYGITQVDLSGGESSILHEWFDLLDYCNSKFEHISCLSHGGRFANMDFISQSAEHGLKEILFSLHGTNSRTHDSITNRPGSFDRILKAIHNAKSLDMVVRINCTVYYKNYAELDSYASLINELDPFEVNFITLNYWEGVDVNIPTVNYQSLTNKIKICIDNLDKNILINVRYVPYCYMIGYEKYVCNEYQHIYDLYDWNKEIYTSDIDVTKPYTNQEKLLFGYARCADTRIKSYYKKVECTTCKYFYICDGVKNEISIPVAPVEGEKIKEVTHYRKNFYEIINTNTNS